METIKGSKNLRKGRSSIAGQYYLITTKTLNKTEVFTEKRAADIVLNSLYWLDQHNRMDLQAAVVMPDHLHFIAGLNKGTLSGLMHSLKSYTSKQIKAELNYSGTIWQSQYHDHAIRKDEELKEMMIYCLHNPVRANIVMDFHDYPYWYCKFNV
jgi:putative transposase